jgi:hypothetical protein
MDLFIPFPDEIENEIEIIPPAEMREKSITVILRLEYKLKKFRHGLEMVIFGTVPQPDQYQIPPIIGFYIPSGILEPDRLC